MISEERALELIQESLDSLRRSGLLESELSGPDTVLLGTRSALDSIAFVTLISDVEERLSRETGKELFLVLTDIHEFNPENTSLCAGTLASFICRLAQTTQ